MGNIDIRGKTPRAHEEEWRSFTVKLMCSIFLLAYLMKIFQLGW
jgi:hypothetical protein